MRIAILDDIHHAYGKTSAIERLRQRADVSILTEPFRDPARLRGFDVLVANRERTSFPRSLFEQLPDLRLLVQTGSHAYHVDFDAARDHGVTVASASGGSNGAAELTIGLMITLMRQMLPADAGVRRGEWPTPLGLVLEGKTLGLVGLGRVGGHVARVARAFEMRVLAWTPSLTDERAAAVGAELCELDDLLRESDVVSVHAALSPASRGLLSAARLASMKPGAYLVNTARGPIVEEAALIAALRDGRLAGAGLDVFDQEPLPPGHPLLDAPNTILTPHIGWPNDVAYERFAAAAADVVEAYLDGRPVPRFKGH